MKNMNILLNIHPTAFQNPGGAELLLNKTKEGLCKKGYDPKVFNLLNDKIDDFDIVHNFTMNVGCFDFCSLVKSKKKPLALSTIYWDMNLINKKGTKVDLNDRLVALSSRMLDKISIIDSYFFNMFSKTDFLARIYPYKKYMKLADMLIPNSYAEADILIKKFKADKRKICVIPYAVEHTFADSNPKLFTEKYGLKDFVLFVGRIDYRKNVLSLIKACRELNVELVIIGSPIGETDNKYYSLCKKAAGKKTHFISSVPYASEILKSAYAAAYTVALPSWFETPGNTVLEGGLAGANIVTTSVGSAKEYFEDYALYVNPASYSDIKNKIKLSLDLKKDNKLKYHLLKNFTWEKVADKTIKAYKTILK